MTVAPTCTELSPISQPAHLEEHLGHRAATKKTVPFSTDAQSEPVRPDSINLYTVQVLYINVYQ